MLLYMVKTGDQTRFDGWLNYLSKLPHNGPFPSYCPNSTCVFKIIDCPLFVTIASRFNRTGEALSLCDPLQGLGLPKPEQIKADVEKGVQQLAHAAARFEKLHAQVTDQLAKAIGLPPLSDLMPTPAQELATRLPSLLKAISDALERLVGPDIAAAAAQFAQEIVFVNAVVNSVDPQGFSISSSGKFVYSSNGWTIEDAGVTVSGTLDYNPNGEHIAAVEVLLLHSTELRTQL